MDDIGSGGIDKEQMTQGFGLLGFHPDFAFNMLFRFFEYVSTKYDAIPSVSKERVLTLAQVFKEQQKSKKDTKKLVDITAIELEPFLLTMSIFTRGSKKEQLECTLFFFLILINLI